MSLDYLKNVVIPDKILKVEKDIDTPTFPMFLKKLTSFNPFIFDDNYLLVDIELEKKNFFLLIDIVSVELADIKYDTIYKINNGYKFKA